MTPSKKFFWLGLVVLIGLSLCVIYGYYSIHKTCCTEELTTEQLEQLQKDASNGSVNAMKRLFFYYAEGGDTVKANSWLQKAAAAGDAEADMFLYDALSVSPDPTQKALAVRYLTSAAQRGYPEAQVTLGELYRVGSVTIPRDAQRAEYWFRRSALSGDEEGILALCNLALLQQNKPLCEECVVLDNKGLASVEPQSYIAKELAGQRERIARKLGQWESERSPVAKAPQ